MKEEIVKRQGRNWSSVKEEIVKHEGRNWSKLVENSKHSVQHAKGLCRVGVPASDGFELFDAVRRVEVGDGHTAPYERRGDAAGQTGLGLGLG